MPPSPVDKLIVTNKARLRTKYGGKLTVITRAITALVKADAGRGLKTVVIDLSDPAVMAVWGGPTVGAGGAGDLRANKEAVDAVYAAHDRPAYILLLGSVDVIPHQELANPLYAPRWTTTGWCRATCRTPATTGTRP